jgi:hypothetical protein
MASRIFVVDIGRQFFQAGRIGRALRVTVIGDQRPL